MNIWAVTDVGAVRAQNQDAYSFAVFPEGPSYAVVCDGMGGARAGNIASSLAAENFSAVIEVGLKGVWEPQALLEVAAQAANAAVLERALHDPDCRGMGTTLVAVLALEERLCLCNVGDSRGYLIQENGVLQVTRDHSLVEDLVARGDITPAQARNHPQKNLITRALGVERHVRMDYFEVPRQPGDHILLCSDGLSNLVSDQEILYEVIHGGPAESCPRRLLEIALSRGAPDNVTAVLCQL